MSIFKLKEHFFNYKFINLLITNVVYKNTVEDFLKIIKQGYFNEKLFKKSEIDDFVSL